MKRLYAILTALLVWAGVCYSGGSPAEIISWICFYGASFPQSKIPEFDLYVFDKTHHPDLSPIKENRKTAVGYVSLGEISRTDPHFNKIPENLLIEENKDWKGSYRVDLRNKKWRKLVLNDFVPSVLNEGFDGIFIDTIDVAQYLENEKGLKGSIDGAVSLIKKIRKKYPKITMVLNNGLFLADRVGHLIDALVVEDVYTLYDFEKKKYKMADDEWTSERLAEIEKFRLKHKKPVLSLDYMDGKDKKAVENVKKRAKSDGLIPYISDIDLKSVFFNP